MAPRDHRNIHTTGKSWRDVLPCANMALKLPRYFYLLIEKPLGCYFQFGLLTIRWHNATRNHLSRTLKVIGQVWESQKSISINTNHDYHQRSSPKASLNWSNNKVRFSFNQSNRKKWGAKLVDIVKHLLPHKAFIVTPSLEGWPTKGKEAPSPHEVRLALLDTNPIF